MTITNDEIKKDLKATFNTVDTFQVELKVVNEETKNAAQS
jgi:hypothetical protein